MAFNLGTTAPSTIKLGTQQVSSIWQGTNKVWPSGTGAVSLQIGLQLGNFPGGSCYYSVNGGTTIYLGDSGNPCNTFTIPNLNISDTITYTFTKATAGNLAPGNVCTPWSIGTGPFPAIYTVPVSSGNLRFVINV